MSRCWHALQRLFRHTSLPLRPLPAAARLPPRPSLFLRSQALTPTRAWVLWTCSHPWPPASSAASAPRCTTAPPRRTTPESAARQRHAGARREGPAGRLWRGSGRAACAAARSAGGGMQGAGGRQHGRSASACAGSVCCRPAHGCCRGAAQAPSPAPPAAARSPAGAHRLQQQRQHGGVRAPAPAACTSPCPPDACTPVLVPTASLPQPAPASPPLLLSLLSSLVPSRQRGLLPQVLPAGRAGRPGRGGG